MNKTSENWRDQTARGLINMGYILTLVVLSPILFPAWIFGKLYKKEIDE